MSLENPRKIESAEKEPSYDAIVVLGAVMRWNKEENRWDFPTTMTAEEYSGRMVMGKARAIAASEVHDEAEKMLVTGGSQKHPETEEIASRAKELSQLIVDRYRVPREKVISIGTDKASHTMGNVENVVAYLKREENDMRKNRIAILSPRFQKERAKMMFDAHPYFKERGIRIDWILVEDILEARHPLYKKWTEAVANTEEASVAEKMEAQGRSALEQGVYRPRDENKN